MTSHWTPDVKKAILLRRSFWFWVWLCFLGYLRLKEQYAVLKIPLEKIPVQSQKHSLHPFFIKDLFCKCDHIHSIRIWSHLLEKPLMENFIFCAVFRPAYVETICRLLVELEQNYRDVFRNMQNISVSCQVFWQYTKYVYTLRTIKKCSNK